MPLDCGTDFMFFFVFQARVPWQPGEEIQGKRSSRNLLFYDSNYWKLFSRLGFLLQVTTAQVIATARNILLMYF